MLGRVVGKEEEGHRALSPFPHCLLAFPCFAFALHPPAPPPKKVISTVLKLFHSQCQQLCKFIEKKKERFHIRKTYNEPKGIIIRSWETAHLPLP